MFGELRPVDGGMPILLEKASITVGQDRTCDVVIEHPSVSANHCLMEFREGHWFIEDLGSRGGIGVNGEKVESAWVPALSVINIGSIEFDLSYSSAQANTDEPRAVSSEILSKLDRAMKSVSTTKERRTQVRGDQPAPANLPLHPLGTLKPTAGGHAIPLLYDELYLGRDPDRDVVLPYLSVAKTHCVLRYQEGYWLVRDLNNNGVRINGEIIQEGWLLPGAVLGIGTHQFEVAYATFNKSAPPEMPVPINEFDVSDAESSVDGGAVNHVSKSEVAEIELSELIEVEEPPKPQPTSRPVDVPLRATDDMLAAIEDMLPPIDEPHSPVTESKAAEPSPIQNGASLAAGLDDPSDTTTSTRPRRTRSSQKKKPLATKPVAIPLAAKTETGERSSVSPPVVEIPAGYRGADAAPLANRLDVGRSESPPSVVTKQQASVVQLKHERIVEFLKDRKFDGLLLSRLASIAWYTGGADIPRGFSGQTAVALLITPEGGTLLARKADRDLLLSDATADLGLQHLECAWPTEAGELLADKLRSKKIASDQPFESCVDVSSEVSALRWPLRPQEIENLRKLGIRLARTVERAVREFQRGDTEAQIAGDVASRLIRHEVHPVRIQVWGDGRGRSSQNWSYGRETVDHDCTISVVARRHGLHVAVSRTVSFGVPSKELRWTFPDMIMAHATALTNSRDQTELSAVWTQVERACETLGEAEDWRATDPGCVTGYELCEAPISAKSTLRLRAGMPVIWRSLIGPARAVDTILVREADSKVITQTGEWPQIGVAINNEPFFVQTVLQRTA